MNTKKNAEAIRKEYENAGINVYPLERVKVYVSIAKNMGLDEFDSYDAVVYLFNEIHGIFNERLSREIINTVDEAFEVYK